MSKKIRITIAVVLILLSIPFCTRWLSAVGYYFSDKGEQASSPLEFSLKGTTAEVVGFKKGQNKETVIIPEKAICCGYLCTVTSIGRGAFSGCSGMTSVKIPSSVTEIGDYAFYRCSGLTGVEIPSSVTEIGRGAFFGCSGLTGVEIPSSVKKISYRVFEGCIGLTSMEMPLSVTEIDHRAFYGCVGLTSVKIPMSVTKIGDEAFKNCYNLNIVIDNTKNNVKVGERTFERCKSVKWKK